MAPCEFHGQFSVFDIKRILGYPNHFCAKSIEYIPKFDEYVGASRGNQYDITYVHIGGGKINKMTRQYIGNIKGGDGVF
jgi:hypothetical protein